MSEFGEVGRIALRVFVGRQSNHAIIDSSRVDAHADIRVHPRKHFSEVRRAFVSCSTRVDDAILETNQEVVIADLDFRFPRGCVRSLIQRFRAAMDTIITWGPSAEPHPEVGP